LVPMHDTDNHSFPGDGRIVIVSIVIHHEGSGLPIPADWRSACSLPAPSTFHPALLRFRAAGRPGVAAVTQTETLPLEDRGRIQVKIAKGRPEGSRRALHGGADTSKERFSGQDSRPAPRSSLWKDQAPRPARRQGPSHRTRPGFHSYRLAEGTLSRSGSRTGGAGPERSKSSVGAHP
jgi:hypothetical protein